jgi:hypothetical protein
MCMRRAIVLFCLLCVCLIFPIINTTGVLALRKLAISLYFQLETWKALCFNIRGGDSRWG